MLLILTMAGGSYGYGHLGRCLPIFNAAQGHFEHVEMVVDNGGSSPVVADIDLTEVAWMSDLNSLDITGDDIVIIDVLDIEVTSLETIQSRCKKLYIVDDVNKEKYQSYNRIDWSIKSHLLSEQRLTLSSPRYVPLKQAFQSPPSKTISEKISKLLITMGGSDIRNLSPVLISFLRANYPEYQLIVFVGPGFQNQQEIEFVSDNQVTLLNSPSEMGMLQAMKQADLAIATGGHTMYELAAVGLPTVQLQIIDNQEVSKYWAQFGFSRFAGWYDNANFLTNLGRCIDEFEPKLVRKKTSRLGQSLIDGNGADKLIAEIK